jgi:hypothetical protein
MDFINAAGLVALFFGMYLGVMFVGFVVDKLLRRVFKRGIFPEGYFKL